MSSPGLGVRFLKIVFDVGVGAVLVLVDIFLGDRDVRQYQSVENLDKIHFYEVLLALETCHLSHVLHSDPNQLLVFFGHLNFVLFNKLPHILEHWLLVVFEELTKLEGVEIDEADHLASSLHDFVGYLLQLGEVLCQDEGADIGNCLQVFLVEVW